MWLEAFLSSSGINRHVNFTEPINGLATASVFKLLISAFVIIIANAALPVLAGKAIRFPLEPQEALQDYSVKGVFQDGLMMTIIAWAAGLIPLYYISLVHSKDVWGWVWGIVVISGSFTWPLIYCLTNNVGHLKRETEKSREVSKISHEVFVIQKERIEELSRHLRMQCQFVLLATFPYCLLPIIPKWFIFIVSGKTDNGNKHEEVVEVDAQVRGKTFIKRYIPDVVHNLGYSIEELSGMKE